MILFLRTVNDTVYLRAHVLSVIPNNVDETKMYLEDRIAKVQ